MTLLIMAAGMGSRFGGLKQIEPIGPNGEFIIDYSIYDAIEAGFTKVVFVIKEENYGLFKNTIGKRFENKIEVAYAFQKQDSIPEFVKTDRTKPWGTGHAILSAKDVINDNFGIINADDFYGRDAYLELAKFLKETNDNNYAMIGYRVKNTVSSNGTVKRGVCTIENNIMTDIVESNITVTNDKYIMNPLNSTEESYITSDALVSMNMFGFTPKLFDYLEEDIVNFFKQNLNNIDKCEYLIPIIVGEIIHNNKATVKVIETTSKWLGMTYREDKEELVYNINKMIEQGIYPNKI